MWNRTFEFYFLWTTVFSLEDSNSSCISAAWSWLWLVKKHIWFGRTVHWISPLKAYWFKIWNPSCCLTILHCASLLLRALEQTNAIFITVPRAEVQKCTEQPEQRALLSTVLLLPHFSAAASHLQSPLQHSLYSVHHAALQPPQASCLQIMFSRNLIPDTESAPSPNTHFVPCRDTHIWDWMK